MITLALEDFRAQVIYLGGLDGLVGTGERHETTEVNTQANQSHRAMRDLVGAKGFGYFTETTAPASLPALDANFDWREVPWAVSRAQVVGVDVRRGTTGRGYWDPLEAIPFSQRHQFMAGGGGAYGPAAYCVRNIPTEGADGSILLVPGGSDGQYVVHYVPEFTDITDGTDFVYPTPACLDWHLADTLVRVIGLRDADEPDRVNQALLMRQRAEEAIGSAVLKVNKAVGSFEIRPARRGLDRRRAWRP